MKDPIKKSEELRKITEAKLGSVLSKLGSRLGIGGGSKGVSNAEKERLEKVRKLSDKISGKQQPGVLDRTKDLIAKHQAQSAEEVCKNFGTKPNNAFFSELGSKSAQFGQNGKVDDISGLGLSKSELMCYDLKVDKYRIAWLFNGDFDADKIWRDQGEIYFKGTWNNGVFKGTLAPESKFEGGTFKGKSIPGADAPKVPQQKPSKFKPKKLRFTIDHPLLDIDVNLDVLDAKEMGDYKRVIADVRSKEFFLKLRRLKKLIKNREVDGFGNFPTLAYLFQQKGQNLKLDKASGELLQYLVNYKKSIIDNMIKRDGSENEHLQSIHIENLKKMLGLATAQPKQTATKPVATTTTTAKAPVTGKKKLTPTKTMKEGRLSIQKEALKLIKLYNS